MAGRIDSERNCVWFRAQNPRILWASDVRLARSIGYGVRSGRGILFSGIASRFVRAPSFDLQLSGVPLSLRADLVLTAGICEEFIYRGFAIEELGALAGSRWLAALVSLIFFTLPHARLYGFRP